MKRGQGPSAIVIIAAALSIVALMLPTSEEDMGRRETSLPLYLHLSVAQKLIAAYVLGKQSNALNITPEISGIGSEENNFTGIPVLD